MTRVSSLQTGDHTREIVLKPGPIGIHVGPKSWVRFGLRDGNRTPWFEARQLKVNQNMVVTANGQTQPFTETAAARGLLWKDVGTIEVNDLDLGKTFVGICAGTGVVVLAATAEALLLSAIGAITRGHVNGDLGITRGAFELVVGQALKRPEADDDIGPEIPSVSNADALDARPLFSSRAGRRDLALFTFASEGGAAAGVGVSSVGGVSVGLRLVNIFELGVGARSAFVASADGGPSQVVSTPFFRFGLHLDLDASRRVALAVGADIGGNSGETHARFLFGIRVRITDSIQVGFYPWNPVKITQTSAAGQTTSSGSSHLNLLEFSWLI